VVAGSIPAAPTKSSGQWLVVSYAACGTGASLLILLITGHRSLTTVFPVFARRSVQTAVGQLQALYWFAVDYVGLDDLVNVGFRDVSVPDRIWIDHQIRAVLALIETAGLVGPHFTFEAAFRKFLFEEFLQLRLAC
jgi:hypothetical protein